MRPREAAQTTTHGRGVCFHLLPQDTSNQLNHFLLKQGGLSPSHEEGSCSRGQLLHRSLAQGAVCPPASRALQGPSGGDRAGASYKLR